MVAPVVPDSNSQGKLGGGNIAGIKGKAGQEGQPIENKKNNRIGEVRVDGGRPEILGRTQTMIRWV